MTNKDEIADMLLRNGLAPTKEHALLLAEKFHSMDTANNNDTYDVHSNISLSINSPKVSYEEDVAISASSPSFVDIMLGKKNDAFDKLMESRTPQQAPRRFEEPVASASQMTEAQRRLNETKVDISSFFNVNNMKKK
jgi:hypothetical protein